jgi:hypothetical protein
MSDDKNMISDEAVEAAVDALVASRLGDHKWINGEEFVEAARAALEAAAPRMFAGVLELHAKRTGDYTDHNGTGWAGEHCGHCRVEWPCATIEVFPNPNRSQS